MGSKKSEAVVSQFFSIKFVSFVTTDYLNRGKFNGMARRDWAIFMTSLILSNAYWNLVCYLGIPLVEWGREGINS
ncbi:MAG: hypothetical protein AB1632_13115 [Nitrospirota bacterium]